MQQWTRNISHNFMHKNLETAFPFILKKIKNVHEILPTSIQILLKNSQINNAATLKHYLLRVAMTTAISPRQTAFVYIFTLKNFPTEKIQNLSRTAMTWPSAIQKCERCTRNIVILPL